MDWRRSSPIYSLVLVAIVLAPISANAQQRAEEPLTAEAVLGAIDRGVSYLKREQSARGMWDDLPGYPGGVTSLCTLALLESGLEPTDPAVAKALGYLRSQQFDKTYCVALQTMALCAGDPDRDIGRIAENAEWLQQKQIKSGENAGAWSYPGARGDPSNAQFAVLALHEAQRAGATIDPRVWNAAATYWRRLQNDDGSWSYPPHGSSGSMTCAGIGALTVINKAIGEGDARIKNGRILCCKPHELDDAIDRGAEWLSRNFSVTRNPAGDRSMTTWHYYYLYGLERAGRLTSIRKFGEHDWYREGAEYLVRAQDPFAHFWRGREMVERRPHVATPLALLFLSKGRRPVLMAKAKYADDPNAWNIHRLDVDHITRRTEQAWDMPLTWQTINVRDATIEDLMQSPVLYFSGSQAADLTPHAEKLRGYIDRGGFLFLESCCDGRHLQSNPYKESVENLVTAMFPEPEYRLRQLRPAHPIWRMERLVRPDSRYIGSLYAVEYGCRACLVFCDRDLSCYWDLDRPESPSDYAHSIQQQIDDATTIGLNVLAYATGREPLGKEQSLDLAEESVMVDASGRRGFIQIGKLSHGGGCDDAPAALANLARAAQKGEVRAPFVVTEGLVNIGDEAFFAHHLSFMHGRHDFRLTENERKRLREYLVENDGMLLGDSICASPAFTKSFRREIELALEGFELEPVPEDDPLFTDKFGGYDIRRVTLRDPAEEVEGRPLESRTRQVPPQLEGVKIDGKWRVLFSPFDLSCALERHEAIECRGYTREDAARIGLNVLLYSINQ